MQNPLNDLEGWSLQVSPLPPSQLPSLLLWSLQVSHAILTCVFCFFVLRPAAQPFSACFSVKRVKHGIPHVSVHAGPSLLSLVRPVMYRARQRRSPGPDYNVQRAEVSYCCGLPPHSGRGEGEGGGGAEW